MTTPKVYVGASKTITMTFKDAAGGPIDPTAIRLVIREADGAETEITEGAMQNPGIGTWTYVFAVTKSGRHHVYVDGQGAAEAAVQSEFYAFTKTTT